MNFDAALDTFIAESRDLLADMEAGLIALSQGGEASAHLNAVFRAAHTIKGSAGLFGLDHIVAFTHVAEHVLDGVRAGGVRLDQELVALLLACCDHLNLLVGAIARGQLDADPAAQADSERLSAALQRCLYRKDAAAALATGAPVATEAGPAGSSANAVPPAVAGSWQLSVRFGPDVLRNGMDPLSFLRYLAQLGHITALVTVDSLPGADDMDPESCYLGYDLTLDTPAARAELEAVFEFVRDDCALTLSGPGAPAADAATVEPPASVAPSPVGEEPKGRAGAQRPGDSRSVRVDADKLDHLITQVGELIIAGASASMIARRAGNSELQEVASRLTALVEEVRDSALQLRMVKIGATFDRFQRVVHDVARDTGKDIVLEISGEDTELDKTVVEKIADPLTHLVRNAIDHGIEPGAVRAAAGKPARGTVRLNAFHDSGAIVIEVSDDGGGLRRERILEKAVERGLVEADRHLSDGEIFALVFEPGFSTAEQVTNLSGRGVGMDVVKRNITALRGAVSIASTPGRGTTVTVRLPLTLAIIDGFLVTAGQSTFVVPLDMIEECIEFAAEAEHEYANLRGQVLPFIRLREEFGIDAPPARRQSIVVLNFGGMRAGLVVDGLVGEYQTVIKPLSPVFAGVRCISGSTILGHGGVALIIDVAALFQLPATRESARLAA